MSARNGRKKKDGRPPGPAPTPLNPPDASDDEIEILEVVGVNETERETEPIPEMEPIAVHDAPHGPDAAALAIELEEARREKDRCHDLMVRSQAELDNLRKRAARDAEQRRDVDAARLVARLLPVLDNLERALRARGQVDDPLWNGIALVQQQMAEALVREGLAPIEAVGAPFDPERHEAVEMVGAGGGGEATVLEEMQKGYLFRGRLVRPALVRVAAGSGNGGGGSGKAGG
jgi:molecular chaperone GrpE